MVASAPERGVRSGVMSAQVSTASDNNDTLAGLLATASVVLDTDRHAAKSCIQRVAALLGIDLGPEKSVPAERSCLRGGLAPWQAKRISSYIEKRRILRAQEMMLSSRYSLLQIALECGMCDQAHFTRVFRRIVGINPK